MKLLTAISLIILVSVLGCTPDPHTAIGAAEDMGFTEVNLGSHAWYGCGEQHSTYTQHFTATRPENGRRVTGIICCSLWNTCSVRLTR